MRKLYPYLLIISATVLLMIGAVLVMAQSEQPTVVYVGVPTEVYQPREVIHEWVETGNIDAMYAHVWNLWSAMTAPSGQFVSGATGEVEIPVWETWFSSYDVFKLGPAHGLSIIQDGENMVHDFEPVKQLTDFSLSPTDTDEALTSFNRFNLDSAQFIWENNYYTVAGMNDRWNECDHNQSPYPDCTLSFPTTAINMKPVFFPIKANAISIIPVWKGVFPADSDQPSVNVAFADMPTTGVGPETWLNCVAINLTGQTDLPATVEIQNGDGNVACAKATVMSLDEFYSVYVTDGVLMQYREMFSPGDETTPYPSSYVLNDGTVNKERVTEGDYFVFVGSHVTTREINEWVWFSVWWSPEPEDQTTIPFPPTAINTQDYITNGQMYVNYPGTGYGRPEGMAQPWDNYVLCINYMYVYPPQPFVGGSTELNPPQFCFNPYLEAGFNLGTVANQTDGNGNVIATGGGINTNCMACHGNANWNNNAPAPGYIRAQYIDRNDPQFNAVLQVDFAWSVAGRPVEATVTPNPDNSSTPEATPAP